MPPRKRACETEESIGEVICVGRDDSDDSNTTENEQMHSTEIAMDDEDEFEFARRLEYCEQLIHSLEERLRHCENLLHQHHETQHRENTLIDSLENILPIRRD